ncbi:hypothetical protein ACQ3I4_07110 [Zafaria sp. Z1313]|uniref:hypothetical protein n=1 Tax=unclassified Zafaria TaxID=2828765 RepID=UPI002E778460|nr:hypothetical protein [Zafaria sp. J156]MEE1620407.1 hypothetical protein [Zafaria sp. J156]
MSYDFFESLRPGERIVVRYRVAPAGGPGPGLTDVLGGFAGLYDDGATVAVDSRHGEVRIERRLVTHAKRVPPAPVRRARRA